MVFSICRAFKAKFSARASWHFFIKYLLMSGCGLYHEHKDAVVCAVGETQENWT